MPRFGLPEKNSVLGLEEAGQGENEVKAACQASLSDAAPPVANSGLLHCAVLRYLTKSSHSHVRQTEVTQVTD